MSEDMKGFITAFRHARGWSLKEMAAQLGYSSTTSLVRVEQGKANLESLLRFVRLMHQTDAMQLTPEEAQALDLLIERRQLTDDAYHAAVLLHSLLRNEREQDEPMYVHCRDTGSEQLLYDYFAARPVTDMLILNCLDMPVCQTMGRVVKELGVHMDHYMVVDDEASHTVQRVLRVLPMTYLNGYNGYTQRLPADQPSGLLRADMLLCQWQAPQGARVDVLIANSPHHFQCHTIPGSLRAIAADVLPQLEHYQPFGDHRLRRAADYLEYLQLCTEMERDREVLRIKPDFGLDQIPPDIIFCAAVDQMQQQPEAQQAMGQPLEMMLSVLKDRYRNYCTKHQPQYHVYKKQAMWHFVKTGQLSDHAWMLRPFTVQERIAILSCTLASLQSNPYLHITFLRDEAAFRNEEIVYYEGTGVSIIKPQTDYNLQADHHETLITQEKFVHIYRTYFLNSIIAMHTIPESQARAELLAMIGYLKQ